MSSTCTVCGGTEFGPAEHATVDRTPYLSCNNCGLWAQYPPPKFRWESELQSEGGKEGMHEFARLLNEDLAERLIYHHKPKNVLDIGSKYPYFLKCFKENGVENVLGIYDCEEAKEYGRELDVPMIVGDFLEYDFGDQKFDLITLVHCIEHFSDPGAALRKIKGLLSERGVIYIRTPEIGQEAIDAHLTDEYYAVHPILFSTASFHRLARQEGLTIFDEWDQPELGQIDWQLRVAEDLRISFCVTSCDEEEVIGRMLESITPLAWELIVYLNNCLSGDTKISSLEFGPVSLKEVEGKTVTVRCRDGKWRKATCRQYGKKKLCRYVFKDVGQGARATDSSVFVDATEDHRWFLSDGSVTQNLKAGDIIERVTVEDYESLDNERTKDDEAVAHGLVWGDGTAARHRRRNWDPNYLKQGIDYCHIRLCGKDKEHLKYFKQFSVTYPKSANGDPVVYVGRKNWKVLPFTNDPAYIANFIKGWWLADGDKQQYRGRSITINTTNIEAVQWLRDYAAYAGYRVSRIREINRDKTNLSDNPKTLYKVRLVQSLEARVASVEALGYENTFCLEEPITSGFVLANGILTGNCTDKTPEIIKEWSERTGIRYKIIDGYWDDNFARAKNEAIMQAEGTHVAWMDCDDVLSKEAPEKILALLAEKPDNPQDWRLIYGGDTFFHLRLWKNEGRPFKPHFHDRCHEYVQLGGYQGMKLKCDDITLRHMPKPKDASGRNIKILMEAEKSGAKQCPYCDGKLDERGRTLFYLGNALREANRHKEALERYDPYLDEGLGWHDERFWAWMYKGQNHWALNQADEALLAFCTAIATNSHWAEPYMAIARIKYGQEKWRESIGWALHAAAQTMPNTLMFLNTGAYRDQPWRMISWCWEHMGDIDKAIQHAEIAAGKIGGEDKEWNSRIAKLRAKRGGERAEPSQKIAQVMRPGALGDIIMSTAACKRLKEEGYFVRYVCHPGSIEAIADNPFVDEVVAVPENNWQKILEHTKELPKAQKVAFFQYPINEGYPDTPMRQHLSHFFCEQAGVATSMDLSIGLVQEHLDYGAQHGVDKVVIHTTAGWSPLKNWPSDRWAELVARIRKAGLEVVQIGVEKEAVIEGVIKLNTPTIRHGAAVQKFSRLFIGGDSIFNHTSQAVGKRSVIIWGSTHPCGSGYDQNVNLVNGQIWTRDMGNGGPTKECQPCYREFNSMSVHPKPPCPNLVPHDITSLPEDEYPARTLNACIASNSLDLVWKYVQELLS